jgi:hypothetical protein
MRFHNGPISLPAPAVPIPGANRLLHVGKETIQLGVRERPPPAIPGLPLDPARDVHYFRMRLLEHAAIHFEQERGNIVATEPPSPEPPGEPAERKVPSRTRMNVDVGKGGVEMLPPRFIFGRSTCDCYTAHIHSSTPLR